MGWGTIFHYGTTRINVQDDGITKVLNIFMFLCFQTSDKNFVHLNHTSSKPVYHFIVLKVYDVITPPPVG